MLTKIKLRMYGNYQCSCGCGKLLGNPSIYYSESDICVGVGLEEDEEGFDWRMFTPECWSKLENMFLEDIYDKYPASSLIEEVEV